MKQNQLAAPKQMCGNELSVLLMMSGLVTLHALYMKCTCQYAMLIVGLEIL